jgi:hypothetical protein
MRVGRVLALVAGGLVLCIALLALAVFLTRDEDNLQVDNLLGERFTLEVTRGGEVDLRAVAPFEWDRALLVAPGTPRAEISRAIGSEWTGIDTVDGDLLIFLRGDEVERFADYRGSFRFEGFARPIDELPPVLHVRDQVIRP